MKKFTKKLVASMMSTAMIMGMSLTAFAADSQTKGISVNGYSDSGKQIIKTWSVAENGLLNDSETFFAATKVLLKLYINNTIEIKNINNPKYINKLARDNTSLKAVSV